MPNPTTAELIAQANASYGTTHVGTRNRYGKQYLSGTHQGITCRIIHLSGKSTTSFHHTLRGRVSRAKAEQILAGADWRLV